MGLIELKQKREIKLKRKLRRKKKRPTLADIKASQKTIVGLLISRGCAYLIYARIE